MNTTIVNYQHLSGLHWVDWDDDMSYLDVDVFR